MPALSFTAIGFSVVKKGNDADECEDAIAHDISSGTFAVADGATDSAFPTRWAKALASAFVAAPTVAARLEAWLKPLQEAWHKSIPWDALPWFSEEKAKTGAFSTLLGLRIAAHREMGAEKRRGQTRGPGAPATDAFSALAVGDSCLFHIGGNNVRRAFPLTCADKFSQSPLLLGTNPTCNKCVWPKVRVTSGSLESGDVFLLATDALACWFLAECERGNKPWNELIQIRGQADFSELISSLRAKGRLRNDDATLLLVRVISRR